MAGFEKNMPVKSRAASGGEFESGIIVRVKANGNYDIEKRVEEVNETTLCMNLVCLTKTLLVYS